MNRIIKWIRLTAALVAAVFAFLVLGACGPFMAFPEITDPEGIQAAAEKMLEDTMSPDRAMILETNVSALEERIRLMEQAEDEIIIASYDVRDGESTRDILAMALRKADEGVSVRFLADGLSGLIRMGTDLFRAVAAHPNIEIRVYSMPSVLEPWKFMGRMHDKYIIVDDIGYILGGRNMFDYFIGDYPSEHRSHDREVLIYNTAHGTDASPESSLFSLRDYFEKLWNEPFVPPLGEDGAGEDLRDMYAHLNARYEKLVREQPGLFEKADYEAMTLPTKGVHLISNPTGLYAKEPVVFHTLYSLMKQAKSDVVIHSPYAVLNDYMLSALEDVCDAVPVTFMINARENGDNIVASSDYTYHRGDVPDTGVKLLEYAGGESYHGKSIAIDENISVIGSFNMDLRSAYVDTELMLVINSEPVNAVLRKNMDALHSDCIVVGPDGNNIVPEGLVVPEASLFKKAVWHVLGLILQPIRILV